MIEINEEQAGILRFFAEHGLPNYVIAHPIESDPIPTKNAFESNLKNIKQLVKLGLIRNETKKYSKLVKEAKSKMERSVSVFTLTKEAKLMFEPKEGEVVN